MMAELARLDPSMEAQQPNLDVLIDGVEEMGRTMRTYRESIEHDPSQLEEMEARISLLHELKRKYGPALEDVITFGERAAQELDTISHSEERVAALQEDSDRPATEIGEIAARMSVERQRAGETLAKAIERVMKELLMGSARFEVEIMQSPSQDGVPVPGRDGRWAYSDKGIDKVEFLISPNPGEPLKPLVKIASGGETSRLMLALKSILSEADLTPTLVFDEVDVGVGGRSGGVVGEKLWALTKTHQVLCITHLPQIAALASGHFRIEKSAGDETSLTTVEALAGDGVVEELMRMLGAEASDGAARKHAKQLLAAAA